MWTIDLPFWWHFVVRAVVVYVFLLMLLRFTGKRQVGQMAPFDLVLLLVLSNAVQNAMNGGDNSITGGHHTGLHAGGPQLGRRLADLLQQSNQCLGGRQARAVGPQWHG